MRGKLKKWRVGGEGSSKKRDDSKDEKKKETGIVRAKWNWLDERLESCHHYKFGSRRDDGNGRVCIKERVSPTQNQR